MPTTYAIPDGRPYFNANLYTGTGATQTITTTAQLGSGAMVWTKTRGNVVNWDTRSTGLTNNYSFLQSNTTNAEETTATQYAMTFSNGSYTVGAGDNINQSTRTFVGYTWALGSAVSNTSGTITSSVQANTTAGVSVVTYTGNGTAGATVGHGLGAVPSMVIIKVRNAADNWPVYHVSLGNANAMFLNTTAQSQALTYWNSTTPSSTVFTLGSNLIVNKSSDTFVAYCFAPVAGYSAFGSYTGNGSADGPFIYTGFRPRWLMTKRTDSSTSGDWNLVDTSRGTYNAVGPYLYANLSNAECNAAIYDILSNGFKIRETGAGTNASGSTYIYAAFAETAFKFSNAR